MAELDPELAPGEVVRVPGRTGLWRIDAWEWRETGVELELMRRPHGPARSQAGDAGNALVQSDLPPAPTLLQAFELPWDGTGSSAQRMVYAAASSTTAGWSSAALSVDQGGVLVPLGGTGRQRSIIGTLATELAPGNVCLLDRRGSFELDLASADFVLSEASVTALAIGANRALVGDEIIQFAKAQWLSGTRWRISSLLRGRGGTEARARTAHPIGSSFILLDDKPLALDAASIGQASAIAATGLLDPAPVIAPIMLAGITQRPLRPVHPRANTIPDGSLILTWTRRARGAWDWRDLVEIPLNEETERYRVGLGNSLAPIVQWDVTEARLVLSHATVANLAADHSSQPLWVSQIGVFAASDPLLLHLIP